VEWDFGDGTTSNFWVPTHYYTSPGTYSVCLTVFGACDTLTECQDIIVEEDVTSIIEIESDLIKLYPNPTANNATIEIPKELIGFNYRLSDQFGRIIMQDKFEIAENELRLTKIEKGVYYISIENSAGLIRLVKY
jgi:PKD repeat protein